MVLKRNNIFSLIATIALAATGLFSCSPVDVDFTFSPNPGRTDNDVMRAPSEDYRNVFIVYSMGFNDLTGYLRDDINDLLSSPLMKSQRDILLICSHFSNGTKFNKLTKPTLTKVCRNEDGEIVKDTLMIMPETTNIANKETLRQILTYTKDNFEAQTYGILLSSHGSGWAPAGYINNPNKFENGTVGDDYFMSAAQRASSQMAETPVYNMGRPDEIPVKSMGVHCLSEYVTVEMDITELAEAFPFKMDYIIFDACYMGGVEVAYQLRNVTEMLVASQTEILAMGMDYKTMTTYLFDPYGPDLEGLCRRYYEYYDAESGTYRSATISLIDCSRLESLAQVSRDIFSRYRTGLDALQNTRDVQKYFRSSYETRTKQQWYFDFADIVENCGLSREDLDIFHDALNEAVIYKAATEYFMSNIKIERHSGLSMYLPMLEKREYLNNFYKTLEWNRVTGLVK